MTGPIGYYVHHHGSGHLHRALTLAEALRAAGHRVSGLSTLPRPAGWVGEWVELPSDEGGPDLDATAGGALHWAPLHHDGVRRRAAAVSAWIERARPALVVSDVSQELTVLARLHGVPVVSVVLPGRRTDEPHRLGLGLSRRLVGFWPAEATRMSPGLPDDDARRLVSLGALSRYPPAPGPAARGERLAVVMGGSGGASWSRRDVALLRDSAPGWQVVELGHGEGRTWAADPWPVLRSAGVVVTHAGQNAVAEVAAARVPAVVVPAQRPFDEQVTTAAQLVAGGWPVVVADGLGGDSGPLLDLADGLDGSRWGSWCDGRAASRFVQVVEQVLGELAAGSGERRVVA